MSLLSRDRPSFLALLAWVSASACSEPCDDAALCGESAASAQQVARADGGVAVTPATLDAGMSASGVTFSVEGSGRAKLVVEGARCAGTRCVLPAVPAEGKVRVDLTLASSGTEDLPVWVRWRGCPQFDGQLWPFWQTSPPSYETLYTHVFQGLRAGSHCVAEVAQGSWYVFAGNLSVKATGNSQYCRDQYSGPENLNLHCFVPAHETISISGNLRSWQCFTDGAQRAATPAVHRQNELSFTATGNQIVSCMGSAL